MGPIFVLVLIVPSWVLIGHLIGCMGGWWALAVHYRAVKPHNGSRLYLRSGYLTWVHYNSVLTIGADAKGLHLACLTLFRAGHPPLFIPWTDITVRTVNVWGFDRVILRFSKAPRVDLSISKSLAQEVARHANQSWADEW